MVIFRQLLAFPLYVTVVWLVWVLIQEVGPRGSLAALAGLVLVAFAAWAYGGSRLARTGPRRLGAGLALAGAVGAVAIAALIGPGNVPAAEAGRTAALSRDALPSEPFTPARLAALEAAHRPVFVYLTASWCITCLVNEHAALDTQAVRHAFAARGIVALRGDWTRQNPEITRLLQQFGRSGVPLYLYYDGSRAPVILPQLLTASRVLATIGKG
jgi:thiol:disulfide interchange protein DsbD